MHKFLLLSRQRRSRIQSFGSSFCTHAPTPVASSREIPRKFTPNYHTINSLSADFDFIPQATTLLKKMLCSNYHSAMKSFSLSDDTKLRIYDELSRKNGEQLIISDLLLALFAFAHGPKDGKQYRLIGILEFGFAPFANALRVGDALSLLTIYCYSCRKHPGESCVLYCGPALDTVCISKLPSS
jgi:hypothetical protein